MARINSELSLYGQVLRALELAQASYVIVGGFAALAYGGTRVTHDVDMIVQQDESQIQTLAVEFPSPRFYADPQQMRDSIERGIMFNIIDSETADKVDLVPLTMDPRNRTVMSRRIRLPFEDRSGTRIEGWFARPDDVIIWGKGSISTIHARQVHACFADGSKSCRSVTASAWASLTISPT